MRALRALPRLLSTMAIMVVVLLVVCVLGIETLAAVRAYVEGESLWSKAQKEAFGALSQYARRFDPADYARFERAIDVTLGDQLAREQLERAEPDWALVTSGLRRGGNSPEDIPRMIRLFRLGRREPHVARAVDLWSRGDAEIVELIRLARELRVAVERVPRDEPRIATIADELRAVNERLTPLEVAFSNTLGDASRLLTAALKGGIVVCGLTLLLFGAVVTRQLLGQMEAAAEQLGAGDARKAAMLEASLDAVISIDGDGRILEFNRAAEQMFGHTRDAVMGREMIELIAPAEAHGPHRAGLARHLRTGKSTILGRRVETTARRADGTTFPVELAIARADHGGPPMFTGFLRDLTERRRTEQELADARKMETIGRLAGGIAHDFNNILTAIIGFAELVRLELRSSHLPTADIEEVQRAATRAQALTAQLLAYSRRQLLTVTDADLRVLVSDALPALRKLVGGQVEVELAAADGRCTARIDAAQVERALMNLAANARDAMPDGGRLRLTTERIEGVAVGLPDRPYVRLSVVDTGAGIAGEHLPRIFEPFFTTKPVGQGTGLGLAMVYGSVKQMGGDVTVDSSPGRGTTFHLYFPASPASPGDRRDV